MAAILKADAGTKVVAHNIYSRLGAATCVTPLSEHPGTEGNFFISQGWPVALSLRHDAHLLGAPERLVGRRNPDLHGALLVGMTIEPGHPPPRGRSGSVPSAHTI